MGRGVPRWSLVSVRPQPFVLSGIASSAGEPVSGRCVRVGPPLSASGPRWGFWLFWSPVWVRNAAQVLSLERLYPDEAKPLPAQFPLGPPAASRVFVSVTDATKLGAASAATL